MFLHEEIGYQRNPIFFSDKDIYVNYDKWKSGESNAILIIGLSGSGKSTLGRKIAEQYNAYYVEIDVISFKINILHKDRANWAYIKKNDKYLYQYFKENNIPPDIMTKFEDYQDPKKNEIITPYIHWLCFERPDRDENKIVIEGGDVAIALTQDDSLSEMPIVFKGTSVAKSIFRRFRRDIDGKDRDLQYILKRPLMYKSQYSKIIPEVNNARNHILSKKEYEYMEESYRMHLWSNKMCIQNHLFSNNNLLLEGYGYKHQPVIFSDNDLYINYDKWKSGEINTCLVTALSGAGKSTISKKLAEQFNAYYVEIDIISFGIGVRHPENANWLYIKKHDKYLYQYFKENNIPPDIMLHFSDYQDTRKNEIINKYVCWLCFERPDKDTNKIIVEGGDVAIALSKIEDLSNFPIVIKGTSIAKSLFRRFMRTKEKKGVAFAICRIFNSWYKQYSKMLPEVNAARKAVMDQEWEEIEESYNPVKKYFSKILWFT